jgi:hypothetical protein
MAYRSLSAALVERYRALEAEQRELDAELAALERARQRRAEIRNELAEVEHTLHEMGLQRRLPLLDRVRVATPCNVSWLDMEGDERMRFCGLCSKNVYNLSAMNADEAEALIYEHEGKLCATFYRRKDGTILTADCTVGRRRKRRRTLAILGLAAAGATACATTIEPETRVSGGIGIDGVEGL